MTHLEISALFFLQLAVILTACRVVGRLVRPLGQPQVVGEMIAGVVLGPSVLGELAPTWHAWLFPGEASIALYCAAQLGLVLYMFLVGMDFDPALLRDRVSSALAVSWAGILAPFSLGAALAWRFHTGAGLFGPGVDAGEAMLFMGAAMSITAFPMLARIIREAGMAGSRLGTLALAAGSADDAAAWCILAVVLASLSGQPSIAVVAIGGGLALGLVMRIAAPSLRRGLTRLDDAAWQQWGLPGTLVLLALAAWFADAIGIYAVFGAFVVGVAMPRGEVQRRLEAQLSPLTTSLLLPLFFTYSGLNTRIGLVDTPALAGLALLVLLAASVGKGVACYAAARLSGESHPDAAAVGALMNARGLMELIILNIGLERGVITPVLFSIMVVMAILTTLAATPVFRRVAPPARPAGAGPRRGE